MYDVCMYLVCMCIMYVCMWDNMYVCMYYVFCIETLLYLFVCFVCFFCFFYYVCMYVYMYVCMYLCVQIIDIEWKLYLRLLFLYRSGKTATRGGRSRTIGWAGVAAWPRSRHSMQGWGKKWMDRLTTIRYRSPAWRWYGRQTISLRSLYDITPYHCCPYTYMHTIIETRCTHQSFYEQQRTNN